MPASLSAQLNAMVMTVTGWSARFGYINRTTDPITRPVGSRNRFYNYPTDVLPPTDFAVGRNIPCVDVPMVKTSPKCTWVLDNTATAAWPQVDPTVVVESITDTEDGLRRVTFLVVNGHNQSVVVEGVLNDVSFGEGQPTYFSPGETRWVVDAPAGMDITWHLGSVAATAST